MTTTFKFTNSRIEKLANAPEGKRVLYGDTEQPKLMLRITPNGAKTFCVVKKTTDGKTRWVTIGQWPETSIDKARKATIDILGDLNAGIDPTEQKRRQKLRSTTLGELLELYLSERDLKPTTQKDYRIKFTRGFDDWRHTPASEITEKMVMNRHQKLSKVGKTTANTTMRVLRLLMRYGKAIKVLDEVPTEILSTARLWHKNKRKDTMIPSDRLGEWYQAVEGNPNIKARTYLLVLLYTGLRHQEGLTLQWKDIDWPAETLTALDTKNHLDHTLPIAAPLILHLKQLHAITGDTPWLFPNPTRTGPLSEAPRKLIKAVITESVHFSPHDLRRTFATIAEAVHLPQTIIKKLLNHVTDNDVTGGYIRTEMETLREAVTKIASYITAKVSTGSNVVQLIGKRG